MFEFILLTLIGVGLFLTPRFGKRWFHGYRLRTIGIRVAGGLAMTFAILSTSYVYIENGQTGHLHRVYLGESLPNDRYVATSGQLGPQADILTPGFRMLPLLNILFNVTTKNLIEIPEGEYGYLNARDGAPLRTDQTYADSFNPEDAHLMITDAEYFLDHGGQRGPQTTVLTPGFYHLNQYLWQVRTAEATEIPAGFVGVIKANVHSRVDFGNLVTDKPNDCTARRDDTDETGALSVPLVPVGCIGVWDRSLSPGRYYINTAAFNVTLVDTRVQTWEYKGGYLRRQIVLQVNQQGEITQIPSQENIPVPSTAADSAIFVKVEGWDVPLEVRVLVQVTPENAPFVVASVGGLEEVENRILTPAIRSIIRNVTGSRIRVVEEILLDEAGVPVLNEDGSPRLFTGFRPSRVLDLIENRAILEENIEALIRLEGDKAGVVIREIRFGEPAIPPELLVARQREQLAQQLARSYTEEHEAQQQRVLSENARATADQQSNLVQAQIEVLRSQQLALAARNLGQGERDRLVLIAEGQQAQVDVLGEESVVALRQFEIVVERISTFLEAHPDVLRAALENAHKFVPERLFMLGGNGSSSGGGLPEAAAILGDLLGPQGTPQQ